MWNLCSQRVGVFAEDLLSVSLSSPGGRRGRWDWPAQVLLWVDLLDDTLRVVNTAPGILLSPSPATRHIPTLPHSSLSHLDTLLAS